MNADLKTIRRDRLQQLLNNRFDNSQAELSRQIGRKPGHISRWLTTNESADSRAIGEDVARDIEQKLDLTPLWLDGIEASQQAALSNFEPAPAPRGQIPLISWVKAGAFCEAIDLLQPGEAEDWITTTVQPRAYTYALRIRGDSMEPTFTDVAIIVVEPEMEPKHGSYVIAKNGDNEATFKQLVQDGSDFYLKPLNPRYPLIPVDTSTCFCGVVREMVMRFD